MAPKGPECQGGCVIYIPISVSDAPVFPLPPPPLAGLVVQIGTHTRSRRGLIAPAAPARRLYCPPVVESQRTHACARHIAQRLPPNTAKCTFERNQIFILLCSLLHCLNPTVITATK
jgi:hypothetical protein